MRLYRCRGNIVSHRQIRSFGKVGSQYDFTGVDVHRLREKAKEIEAQQKGMKKKINPKVINMIDTWVVLTSMSELG